MSKPQKWGTANLPSEQRELILKLVDHPSFIKIYGKISASGLVQRAVGEKLEVIFQKLNIMLTKEEMDDLKDSLSLSK